MTVQDIRSLKVGDKIKEVVISSRWSELGRVYVVTGITPNTNTESELLNLKDKRKTSIPSSYFDKMLFRIRNKIPTIVHFGDCNICSGYGVMNNFEKVLN